MDIQLLGPVLVVVGGGAIDIGPPRQRLVLAALALDAGKALQPETLVDRVWGQAPPQRARETLYVYIARIRGLLQAAAADRTGAVIARRSNGYALDIDAQQVDVLRFQQLVTQARAPQCSGPARVELLRQALGLWRGELLADLTGDWVDRARQAWQARHFDAVGLWADAELESGDPAALINPLVELVDAHPLAESLTGLLMRALTETGRRAEALDRFAVLRRRLADELGADPSPQLCQVHETILRGDRAERRPRPPEPVRAAPVGPVTPGATRLNQLPLNVRGFVGRDQEMRLLDKVSSGADGSPVLVTGTAGVGKTALALRWAHLNSDRFGDGSLYANLRGFEPSAAPVAPLVILGRFLRGLGVDAAAIPRDLDEASALYRSLLADRHVLVLLDNARDATQIRPLLPGSASSLVLVTSRNRLGGLVAGEGARLVGLSPLTPQQSEDLLGAALGAERVAAEPEAAALLSQRCAYLPLALRVAAANLATRPHLTVHAYAMMLAETDSLGQLHADGDEHTAVSAAFDVSFTGLSAPAQTLFRLASLVPGPDFDTYTAAALAGARVGATRTVLDELCTAHLLSTDDLGRLSAHDLLRAYAADRMQDDDLPVTMEPQAARRMVDFYTDTAHEACVLLHPRRNESPRDLAYPPADQLRFADPEAALKWHDQERDTLLGVIDLAARHGWHRAAWQLSETLFAYFSIRRQWSDWIAACATGLASAEAIDDPDAVARLRISVGAVCKQTGDYGAAREHWTIALQVAEAHALQGLTSACHVNLGGLCINEGDPAAGAEHLRTVLGDPDYTADPRYAIPTYINYGCALIELGSLDEAAAALEVALTASVATADLQHVCHAHHNLAEVALCREDTALATLHAQQQLETAIKIGDPQQEAAAWDLLASASCRSSRDTALTQWQRAYELFERIDHRMTEPLAEWLRRVATLDLATIGPADSVRRRSVRRML